jgi:transposase-like protein
MPKFREEYTVTVDLGDLGRFVLRELDYVERETYDKAVRELQDTAGILPEMTSEERVALQRVWSPEERHDYFTESRRLETEMLLKALVSWDGDIPVSAANADRLPALTRTKLLLKLMQMSLGTEEEIDFFGRSSTNSRESPLRPVLQAIPKPPSS